MRSTRAALRAAPAVPRSRCCAPAPARARAHEFLRLACMHSTTRRKNWCRRRDSHSHELALTGISGRRVYYSATSAKWIRPGDLRSARPDTTGCVASYAWPAKNGRDGRTRTSAVREDGAFTARCNCCSATSRKLGAQAGFAPAQTRRMKPSHCCCATEPKWWVVSAKQSGAANQQVGGKTPSAKRESNAPSSAG